MTKPKKLRSQLAVAMIATAIVSLLIFVIGMLGFYLGFQKIWVSGLSPKNKETLELLMRNGEVEPDAFATFVSTFSLAWSSGYADQEFYNLLMFSGISILCSIVIGFWIAGRLSRPIEAVTIAAQKVSKGNLNAQIDDEIAQSSEAQNLVQSFNQMTSSLQAAEREIAASSAAIAHELRTPLTILRGRLQGLSDGTFKPEQKVFDALLGQVETLANVVNDLSTVTRLNSENYEPKLELTDTKHLITSVLNSFETDFAAAGIHSKSDLIDAQIDLDPSRIRQALNAILENAIRYARDGGLVQIETSVFKNHFVVRISDNGPGLPHELHEKVFDRW